MDNKDEILKALREDLDKRANDIAKQLDYLHERVERGNLSVREAISQAFILGTKI